VRGLRLLQTQFPSGLYCLKMKTEIALIANPKLDEIVQKSGVELTKAEAHVKAFHPALSEIAELSRPLANLSLENPDDAKIARDCRLKLVKVRTGAESIKDDRKKVLLAESNLIQSAFNLVKDACILTESQYAEIEKAEERREALRRETLKAERVELLSKFEVDTTYLPLDLMDDDQFENLLASEKEKFEAVIAARAKAEADRIEAERLAEEQRLAEIEAEKKRQAERDAENARLKKEADEREKQIEAERLANEKKLAEAKAESDRIEAEREKQLAEERKEAAKIAAQKQAEIDELKKKQDAIDLQIENERLAKIAEQEAKDAAAKALLLAPDKEKVKAFYLTFQSLKFPDLESDAGKKMSARVNEALDVVKKLIIQDSKTLL